MKKKVAIVQSFYIPWKGYFDLMNMADEFILFDDMQYLRRFWNNRNRIKTPDGPIWLTIPVQVKGKFTQPVKETVINNNRWPEKHWETIKRNYSRAPFFAVYHDTIESLYLGCQESHLSNINYRFIEAISEILGITTKLSWSMDYQCPPGKTERLVSICQQAEAGIYISGPSAKDYLEEDLFDQAGIELQYMDYSDYAEYPQLHPPFIHEVSVIDLIFNTGPDAPKYMKSYEQSYW